jgi:DNA polymerase-1
VLLSCDFSQIELRVGAFYCRDEKMLDTYRRGGDIHAQTTSVIYGIPFTRRRITRAGVQGAPHRGQELQFRRVLRLFPRGFSATSSSRRGWTGRSMNARRSSEA